MIKESLDTIERVTQEFLGKLGAEGEIKVEAAQEGEVSINVTLQEPQLFIGERGQTLSEIAHVLKALIRRKLQEPVRLTLDINDYQKNKEQYLRELARTAADEVALLKIDKELPAMTSADRRIVHLELAERQDVVSESVGEGPERRVVIRIKATTGTDPLEGSAPDL
jgi:spoIIIJ-associated protein